MPVLPPIPFAPGRVYDPTRSENTIMQLMLHQGDVAANRAYNTANIWGNTVANLGQIGGQYMAQKQQQDAQNQRGMAITQALSDWDGDPQSLMKKLIPITGPEAALKLATGAAQLQKQDQPDKVDWESGRIVTHAARTLYEQGGDAAMSAAWPTLAPKLQKYAAEAGMGLLPPQWDPKLAPYLMAADESLNPKMQGKEATPGSMEWYMAQPPEKRAEALKLIEEYKGAGAKEPTTGSLDQQLATAAANGDQAAYQRLLKVKRDSAMAGREPKPAPEMSDFSGVIRKSSSGVPYVAATDVNTGKEATELSRWARANGVQFLPKDRANVLSEVQNARADLQAAYESVKDLFADSWVGIGENKISAKAQMTDAGQRLAAYRKTVQEAATRVSRATSGAGGIRFSKELLAASRQAMPDPVSDMRGTAEKGYARVMQNLQNVEDSILGGQGEASGAKVETKPVPTATVGRFTVEVEQ